MLCSSYIASVEAAQLQDRQLRASIDQEEQRRAAAPPPAAQEYDAGSTVGTLSGVGGASQPRPGDVPRRRRHHPDEPLQRPTTPALNQTQDWKGADMPPGAELEEDPPGSLDQTADLPPLQPAHYPDPSEVRRHHPTDTQHPTHRPHCHAAPNTPLLASRHFVPTRTARAHSAKSPPPTTAIRAPFPFAPHPLLCSSIPQHIHTRTHTRTRTHACTRTHTHITHYATRHRCRWTCHPRAYPSVTRLSELRSRRRATRRHCNRPPTDPVPPSSAWPQIRNGGSPYRLCNPGAR